MPQFFISHSESESAVAHRLADFLSGQGFSVWIDSHRSPAGVSFLKEVEEAIRQAEFLMVIWSNAASKSRWVRLELDIAQSFHKRIIPVLLGEDNEFEMLTDGDTIRLSSPQGLGELMRILTATRQTSDGIQSPRPEDRLFSLPARRSNRPLFLIGLMIGFFGFLSIWFWFA